MKKLVQCVSLLNSYLAVYCTDIEAWKELCFLNIESGEASDFTNSLESCCHLIDNNQLIVDCESEILCRRDAAISAAGRQRCAAERRNSLLAGDVVERSQGSTIESTSVFRSLIYLFTEDRYARVGSSVLCDGAGAAAAEQFARVIRLASVLCETE